MKITFPLMGNMYIALKAVFEELGAEVIIPPKCNKRTLELGTLHSPELICIPFKITLGNYLESIEKGADTLFMWGGSDPCRIGYYNMIQEEILNTLGYDIEMICGEPFKNLKEIKSFLNKLSKVSNTSNYFKLLPAFIKGIKLIYEIDEFDDLVIKTRPREMIKGEVDKLYSKFEEEVNGAKGYKETLNIIRKKKEELKNVLIDKNKQVIRIGIVGEIYTVLEPYINLDIIKKLGNMGVEVHRSVTSSEFIKEQIDFLPFINSNKEEVHRAAEPYLNTEIGGHARHTIGNTVLYSEKDFDGVIHLLPFTCMPEIVAQSILPTIEKEKNIPVLKLILDEMTGEAGYSTRIEAFVDLLQRKKEAYTQ
ncbi:acyl-CoA dehydratase activase-related protein [Anaeromicrobium sediminis]|uniref:CoA protein activase n=1 Tax=Anaeromicrobium sediminis TaxID=1478221 RepID=A0A267MGB5_9FIRM|nr:acyl-CoA dehydratase activase-related protein [Anaeromicrobium sediminis]PAB57833.1 CoA protein activase [Anaeromicrobium sediminis]